MPLLVGSVHHKQTTEEDDDRQDESSMTQDEPAATGQRSISSLASLRPLSISSLTSVNIAKYLLLVGLVSQFRP